MRSARLAYLALVAALPAAAQHAQHAEHAPPSPSPASVSDADRAAAFPDLGTMRMSDMHLEDPLNKLVLLDRLESQNASGGDVLAWNLESWVGRDLDKLWIRSEGDRQSSDTERAELELLYGRGLWPWWELVAGTRIDFAPGGDQSWAAVGVRGLTPYRFDVEATAYLGSGGRAALRLEATYELLVTNRLILEPLLELNWHGQTDTARAIGAGLSDGELGLRLRYEVRREIAPYVGLVRDRSFGRTADLARAAGHDPDDTRLVAGVRLWF